MTTNDGRPMTAAGGQVQCHSGYEYAQRPIAFHWEGERIEVAEVIATWRHPDGKRFRVRTSTDLIFMLRYNDIYDEWTIQQL